MPKGKPITIPGSGGSARFAVVVFALALGIAAIIASRPAPAQNYESKVTPLIDLTNVAQSIKASPGALLSVSCYNPNATTAYVQFFDRISAVVVGTTVPTFSWAIPPTSVSGPLPPPTPARTYFAGTGMQAAAATTATGGTAPTSVLNCDFSHR